MAIDDEMVMLADLEVFLSLEVDAQLVVLWGLKLCGPGSRSAELRASRDHA